MLYLCRAGINPVQIKINNIAVRWNNNNNYKKTTYIFYIKTLLSLLTFFLVE